jgi:hypothetical protein
MTSSSGLRGHRRTYLTILKSADHALFKMVRYVLLRPLRPELDVIQNNCRVRFVGISRYVHCRYFRYPVIVIGKLIDTVYTNYHSTTAPKLCMEPFWYSKFKRCSARKPAFHNSILGTFEVMELGLISQEM